MRTAKKTLVADKKPCPSCFVLHTPDRCPTLARGKVAQTAYYTPSAVVSWGSISAEKQAFTVDLTKINFDCGKGVPLVINSKSIGLTSQPSYHTVIRFPEDKE